MGHPTARVAAPAATLLLLLLTFSFQLALLAHAAATATVGFYGTSCPRVEAIVQQVIQSRFTSDPTVTSGLLRMYFHDCFVTGCDASLLIDSTPSNQAEKDAAPNLTVRDFDVIDDVKTAVEAACPGVVSCADIMSFATRDAIVLAGGPNYAVGGGRLDSLTSIITDANILPSPTFTVEQSQQAFASQGLSLNDMVVLLGAHTVGFAHCGFFSDRVFDFQGTGQPDPTMNPTLVSKLSGVCPNPAGAIDPTVALDQGTLNVFDSSYYTELTQGNGILQIDQELFSDGLTSSLVNQFTNQASFFSAFVQSIITLSNLNIKTSPSQGQIRLQCSKVNPINVPTPPTPTTPQPQSPPPLPPPKPPTIPPPKPPTIPPPRPPTIPPPKPPTIPPPRPPRIPPPKPPTPKPPTPKPPTPKPPTIPPPKPPTPKPPTPKPMPPTPKPKPPTPKPKPRPRPTPRPRPRPRPIPRPRKPLPPPKFHKPTKTPRPHRPPTRKPIKKPTNKPIKPPTKKPIKKPTTTKPTKKPTKKPTGRI